MRRKLQHIGNKHIIYFDECHLRISDAPLTTLVAPEEKQYIIVDENTTYASRYDMIAFICGEQTFPAMIYSPADRTRLGVSGITKEMLNRYIINYVSRYVGQLDRYPWYIVCDRSAIHSKEDIIESFRDGGVHEIVDVLFMPTKAAKRLSPLDNGIFHIWKNNCRQHGKMTKNNIINIMNQEWERITRVQIQHAYKHCGLTTSHHVYFDCPDSFTHQHT
jgi:hypothetical protein